MTEEEIDAIIEAQANDETAWEEPVSVKRSRPCSVTLPPEMAQRAAFFARLHREASVEEWVRRVVQERLDLEEGAFAGIKRELATVRE